MSGKTKAAKASKSNYFSKGQEIRRCNDMRVRIKTYCKQQSITQPQLADKMGVTKSQMNSFMVGSALTGSEVYTQVHPLFRSPPCRSLPIFHNAPPHRDNKCRRRSTCAPACQSPSARWKTLKTFGTTSGRSLSASDAPRPSSFPTNLQHRKPREKHQTKLPHVVYCFYSLIHLKWGPVVESPFNFFPSIG